VKIQKGKLSTSNVVVIGVLVVLLYLVMPADSSNKSSGRNTTESAEVAGPQSPPTVIEPAPATRSEELTAISGNMSATSKDAAQVLAIRPLLEIDEHRLQVLMSENPFCTSAVVNAPESRSADASESTTEITESSSSTSAPVEQQPARISLIYTSSRGTKAAILNDQIVYPGSRTADNARVVSVHPQGIEVQSDSAPVRTLP
jgi:hypothetical protein